MRLGHMDHLPSLLRTIRPISSPSRNAAIVVMVLPDFSQRDFSRLAEGDLLRSRLHRWLASMPERMPDRAECSQSEKEQSPMLNMKLASGAVRITDCDFPENRIRQP